MAAACLQRERESIDAPEVARAAKREGKRRRRRRRKKKKKRKPRRSSSKEATFRVLKIKS